MFVNPVLESRDKHPRGLHAAILTESKIQVPEKTVSQNNMNLLRTTRYINLWPLHVYLHVCMHTHLHVHTHVTKLKMFSEEPGNMRKNK